MPVKSDVKQDDDERLQSEQIGLVERFVDADAQPGDKADSLAAEQRHAAGVFGELGRAFAEIFEHLHDAGARVCSSAASSCENVLRRLDAAHGNAAFGR